MSYNDELIDAITKAVQQANLNSQEGEQLMSKHPFNTPEKPYDISKGYDDSYFEKHAAEYIDFTYKNPTIFHVVEYFSEKLRRNGFKYLPENAAWSSSHARKFEAGKYFTVRGGTALVAFVIGHEWSPSKGVGVIGSHIDSLTVPLKPSSLKDQVDGYDLLGVAPYAGGLSNLWWDRDLGIGGRLIVKSKEGTIRRILVDSTPHPIAKIPTLAPHFGEPSVGPFNKETQAVPVIGFSGSGDDPEPTAAEKKAPLFGRHPLKLLRYIASRGRVKVEDILEWDLQLYDVQKGVRGGLDNEFIFAPRVDDRVCSYAAISSLLESSARSSLQNSDSFSIVGLFDNEEIGSATRTGIKGQLIETVISRVLSPFDTKSFEEDLKITYANSIILSADVNHLVNPNFSNVYLEHHKPVPNKGITISLDPNGNMATDSVGLALMEELARENGDKLQYFQIRNDSRSGGTIGPSISLQTGARTIDLGIPQLSMHSIRATLGARDVGLGTKFFNGFFTNWNATYKKFGDL